MTILGAPANAVGWVEKPDLSKVDEVGFVDFTPGSGHGNGGFSDVGWIEVQGKPLPRYLIPTYERCQNDASQISCHGGRNGGRGS